MLKLYRSFCAMLSEQNYKDTPTYGIILQRWSLFGLYLNAGEEDQKFTCSHLNSDSPLAAKLGDRLVYAPSLGSLM